MAGWYSDRVELFEKVVEVAWRRGSVEVNESCSSARGARILTNRGWAIYSTTEAASWEELEEKALAIAKASGLQPVDLPPGSPLCSGKAVLGGQAQEPAADCSKLALLASALLQEGGLSGEVLVVYSEQKKAIEHPEGRCVEEKVYTELYVFAEAEAGPRRSVGSSHAAWLGPPSAVQPKQVEVLVEKAARRSLAMVKAKAFSPLERGYKHVVLADEASAAFFHELAHLLEADVPGHLKPGQLVSTKSLEVKDDPISEPSPASMLFDDEASPARRRQLVEDGTVVGLLHTRETAAAYEDAPGPARGLFHRPKAMHTTLVVGGGDWRENEMLEETKSGVLVSGVVRAELSEGVVRLIPEEAWLVSKGELKEPVRVEELKLPLIKALTEVEAIGRTAWLRVSYEKGHVTAEKCPWVKTSAYVM